MESRFLILILTCFYLFGCRDSVDYQLLEIAFKTRHIQVLSSSYVIDSISLYDLQNNYLTVKRINEGKNEVFLDKKNKGYNITNNLIIAPKCDSVYLYVRIKRKDIMEYQYFEANYWLCSDSIIIIEAQKPPLP